MTLPWDRFSPDEPVTSVPPSAPTLPAPTAPPQLELPAPPHLPTERPPAAPAYDVGTVIEATMRQTIRELLPALKDQAISYARQTVDAVKTGQRIDHTNPTITTTTTDGKTLVVADAKSRSWRTFLQGLLIDLGFALTAVLTTLAGVDPFAKETWIVFGALVIKTIVQTAISYLARLQVTPTVKTREGNKLALMPVARPMQPSDRMTRRSDRDAEIAPLMAA